MKELMIVHLSDLHITEGPSLSVVNQNLLDDIVKEVKARVPKDTEAVAKTAIVIVVTGDIFHQGPKYKIKTLGYKSAYELAEDFFDDLYDSLVDYDIKIYMAPGNHDKSRTKKTETLVDGCRLTMNNQTFNREKMGTFSLTNNTFKDNYWSDFKECYLSNSGTGYLELANHILDKFGMKSISETFYLEELKFNDKKYCFVVMDTAWSCIGDKDIKNLMIGDFQIQDLVYKYHENYPDANTKPDLTFIIAHHPYSFFNGRDEDYLYNQIILPIGFKADFYLCGHVHESKMNNLSTLHHTVTTLSAGIGWPETAIEAPGQSVGGVMGKGQNGMHCYGIYTFNLRENCVDVTIKEVDETAGFTYRSRQSKIGSVTVDDQYHYPINVYDQKCLTISVSNPSLAPGVFLSTELMNAIQKYVHGLTDLHKQVDELIDSYQTAITIEVMDLYKRQINYNSINRRKIKKLSALSDALYDRKTGPILIDAVNDNKPGSIGIEIEEFLYSDKVNAVVGRIFEAYLNELNNIYKLFFLNIIGSTDPKFKLRVHFRMIESKYLTNYSSSTGIKYKPINWKTSGSDEYACEPSGLDYGDLLKESFDSGNALIFTANANQVKIGPNKRWKDFITISLKKNWNTLILANLVLPVLTFGVSVTDESGQSLLKVLELFDFSEIVSMHLDQYRSFLDTRINDISFISALT